MDRQFEGRIGGSDTDVVEVSVKEMSFIDLMQLMDYVDEHFGHIDGHFFRVDAHQEPRQKIYDDRQMVDHCRHFHSVQRL